MRVLFVCFGFFVCLFFFGLVDSEQTKTGVLALEELEVHIKVTCFQ